MKKYNVHFNGYWKCDLMVSADNEEDAYKKAFNKFCDTPVDEFWFENGKTDIWEVSNDTV